MVGVAELVDITDHILQWMELVTPESSGGAFETDLFHVPLTIHKLQAMRKGERCV